MRWDLIDKFEFLKKGESSRAVKAFTGKEDFFAEHFPGQPVVPEPLLIETMAQTGGVLYGLGLAFKKEVILAKIENAVFFSAVRPPCCFVIEAFIQNEREEGAWIQGVVSESGKKIATADILLVSIDALGEKAPGKIVFNQRFLNHYDILNVAKKSEGINV